MRFKLTEKMADINRQRAEVKAELTIIDDLPCSVVSFDRVATLKERATRLSGYVAALEFAIMVLDTNNE